MKLCIDCQWYGGVAIATCRDVCKHPDNKHIDPVHGLDHDYDCQQLRKKRTCAAWKANGGGRNERARSGSRRRA